MPVDSGEPMITEPAAREARTDITAMNLMLHLRDEYRSGSVSPGVSGARKGDAPGLPFQARTVIVSGRRGRPGPRVARQPAGMETEWRNRTIRES